MLDWKEFMRITLDIEINESVKDARYCHRSYMLKTEPRAKEFWRLERDRNMRMAFACRNVMRMINERDAHEHYRETTKSGTEQDQNLSVSC